MTSSSVDDLLQTLQHPRREEVQALRVALLGADPGISEHVKWNAPSFRHGGEDRVMMRLAPRDAFQLVLHRGSRVREDTAGFRFEDPSGLVRWVTPDRGVVDLSPAGSLDRHLDDLVALVRRWVVS